MPIVDTWHKTIKQPDGSTRKVRSAAYGRGKRWAARYRDSTGEQRSPKFATKPEAERHLNKALGDLARGEYIDPKAGKITLRAFAKDWLRAQTFDESTRQQTEQHFRLHVYPQLGDRELKAIRPSVLQTWLRGRQEVLADSTVLVVFKGLSAMLSAAVDDEVIAKNPCQAKSVKPPVPERRKVEPWPVEQVAAVAGALLPRYRAMVALGAGCGMRQGEVFGLAVEDVEFPRSRMRVRRQVKIVRNVLCFAPPKGGKERELPLPERVAVELAEHMHEFESVAVTLPWRKPDGKPVTARLVFTTTARGALRRTFFNDHVWKPALAAAEVIPARSGKRYAAARTDGFHALRHHFASVTLDGGVSVKALAEYLGHADAGFTLAVYAHMMPASDSRMCEAIDRAWSGIDVPEREGSAPHVRRTLG